MNKKNNTKTTETKWNDYAQGARQEKKPSKIPGLLKTTGVLAGVALVPCLSAGTAKAAIITGTNFTGGPVVSFFDLFGAFNGLASWYIPSSNLSTIGGGTTTAISMSWSDGSGEVLRNPAAPDWALVMAVGAPVSAGAGAFEDYMGMPASGDGYLGIIFDNGSTHYGWIQVEVSGDGQSMELISWGYSDTVDQGVYAGGGEIPEPTSLALLACGAAGLVAKRRRKKKLTA